MAEVKRRPASAEAILEDLVDGVLELDSAWRITYLNPGAARVLGKSRDALIGSALWDEFPDLDSTPFGPVYRKAMAERTTERVEGEYAPLNSCFEARVFPTPHQGLVIFFRDVGEEVRLRKKAETLTETRAILDALMHFSTSLIYAKDTEGRFILVNRKLEEMLGFAPGMLVGRTDHDVFPAEIADPFLENDRTVMRERLPMTVEEEVILEGERRTNLSVKFPLERPDGTVFGTGGVSTDITERVRHQKEVTQLAEQLQHEASLRELFMAVLAHDLRNPLSAIQIGASTLARREDLPEIVVRGSERIVSSAQRMSKLIEQVLDLTRARAMGGIPVDRRPTDLGAVVDAVVEEVRAAHPTRTIEVVVRGECGGKWDPDRLAQAVSNLVGNAVTHGTPKTPVRVELIGDGQVMLTVHNESAPIPPEQLATLFDPFRRGQKSRRGLGLGLYITDQIVRAHGGSIVVESDTSGTTFRVTLPR